MSINVLSLFDGMGGARQALKQANIKVNKYYASEIDKHAIKVSLANHSDIIQIGDIKNVSKNNINVSIDLLICGFPCQDLSIASHKRKGLKGKRSGLFYEAIRLLKEIKPKYFLFENVRMTKDNENIINDILGCKPYIINSSLLSAQNRLRFYWSNLKPSKIKDLNINLKDILESGFTDRKKSYCIDANYSKGGNLKNYFDSYRRQLVFGGAFRGRKDCEGNYKQLLELRKDYKSNSLTTVQKDTVLVHVGDAEKFAHYNYRATKAVYHMEGKSPTLLTMSGGNREPKVATYSKHGGKIVNLTSKDYENLTWRKLTPLECERLQTVPDNYTNHVSNSQRYKMLGNGFTVSVIQKFVENIK